MWFEVGALRVSFDPGVDLGIERDKESVGLILIKHFDSLKVVFLIKEIDILFNQFHGGFVNSSMQRDSSVTVHFTSCPDAKEVREVFGSRPQKVKVLGIPIPWRFFCRTMNGSMIGLVTPLLEPLVQGGQRKGGWKKGEKLHS